MSKTWPYSSLTQAPTNLKEAIDWVLRVTGRDGKKNEAAQPASTNNAPHCLCYLAKAVKDLLYDAKDPGSPGPSTDRYWDNILLEQEKDIVHPVLQDLGLLSGGSTGAASTRDTCAGGTEVIRALIDHLAQGLQKWVGWQEVKGGQDVCCLNTETGIGKGCDCAGGAGQCCNGTSAVTPCHECDKCGTSSSGGADQKCYLSAYCKPTAQPSGDSYWPTISGDSTKVHLLARIFLGSVCLIWSGLSQLGFLTGGTKRWETSKLHDISGDSAGLGSFMAAMGYDLDRLNQGSGGNTGNGEFVQGLLTDKTKGVPWQEFKNGADKSSVAEYYSTIYENAKGAAKSKSTTESICKDYPLLVLHILASGYFRAGSAGAKGIIPAPKAPTSETKKETPSPRKPRTIREILYWLSALPYSEKYKALVERMGDKFPEDEQKKGQLQLHGEGDKTTDLKRDDITHYLMAACGYCPLVLIGIQGTIATSGTENTQGGSSSQNNPQSGGNSNGNNDNRCPQHKKDPKSKRCTLDDKNSTASAAPAPKAPGSAGEPLKDGEVCYGGYHLAVKDFGPLHGMYANGLYGFDMGGSPAQCLDQLRVYVYHCFYQLYFLRKQCSTGAIAAGGVGVGSGVVLGWQSCRYGSGVYWGSGYSQSNLWRCKTEGTSNGQDHSKKCGLQDGASGKDISPLMCYLCDGVGSMACDKTRGKGSIEDYPSIEDHMNMESPIHPTGHLKMPQGHCPVPMGWKSDNSSSSTKENHFKDLNTGSHKQADLDRSAGTYPAHCTGNTLSHLLEYYCDPEKCHGTLVVLLRLLACITPTVPRTLGDLFGFYYYIVYIGGNSKGGGAGEKVHEKLKGLEGDVRLGMKGIGNNGDAVVEALTTWNNSGICSGGKEGHLKCLTECANGGPYLSPLSGQQYGQLSPVMAGTYLSWLVYLIEGFKTGLEGLEEAFRDIQCKDNCGQGQAGDVPGCNGDTCKAGTHGNPCGTGSSGSASQGVCGCPSVVSCTGVLPVLYKYGFGYGDVKTLHNGRGGTQKQCHDFLGTLDKVLTGDHLKSGSSSGLHHEINKLIYTTRLPWIFVLTLAWLVAVLYLAFGAIWPLDWTHMRSHCRGWFRKGSLSPWEVLMVGKMKGRSIVEYFGRK